MQNKITHRTFRIQKNHFLPAPAPLPFTIPSDIVSMYTIYMRTALLIQSIGYAIILGALVYILSTSRVDAPVRDTLTSTKTTPMATTDTMRVQSPAFGHEEVIPSKYTCDGENISPPIAIDAIPAGTVTLTLIVEDPDVPHTIREDGMWNHWVVFNIPPTTTRIGEGEAPKGVAGITTSGSLTYGGPCPPDGEHRYMFRVYALDTTLDLPEGASKEDVLTAMQGHILESTTLMGRYTRIGQ